MTRHRQKSHADGQRERVAKASLEVMQFWEVIILKCRQQGLKRHAAFSASTGMILQNLRVHGAGIRRPIDRWR
jgi:hypothetical protein